jgi:ABC-type glycerol-3-phosphate transport system substrate-binding protein
MRQRLPGVWCVAMLLGCKSSDSSQPASQLRFLHTFTSQQAQHVAALLSRQFADIDIVAVPFARARQVLRANIAAKQHCPDVARIDATWLPELVADQMVTPVPSTILDRDVEQNVALLTVVNGQAWAVPHSIDGLVIVRQPELPAPDTTSLARLTASISEFAATMKWPLQLRADGYWAVPWLRADAELLLSNTTLSSTELATKQLQVGNALGTFSSLFGAMAAPSVDDDNQSRAEITRFADRNVGYWIAGSWQLRELPATTRFEISPLINAPLGAQLLVVPSCSTQPELAWKLVQALTDSRMSQALGSADGLLSANAANDVASNPTLSKLRAALSTATPLPSSAATPRLFDDLTPAIRAIIDDDASADDAAAGLIRSWTTMMESK